MNEKEAREPLTPTTRESAFYAGQKKGYLEALEKAKVLAECLDHAYIQIDNHENHVYKEEMDKLMTMIENVLFQWEKEK